MLISAESHDSAQPVAARRTCCSCWSQRSSPTSWRWKTTGAALKLKGSSSAAAPAFMNGCRSELSCRRKEISHNQPQSAPGKPLWTAGRPFARQSLALITHWLSMSVPPPHLCSVNLKAQWGLKQSKYKWRSCFWNVLLKWKKSLDHKRKESRLG